MNASVIVRICRGLLLKNWLDIVILPWPNSSSIIWRVILRIGCITSFAHIFRILPGKLSGPVAFCGSVLRRICFSHLERTNKNGDCRAGGTLSSILNPLSSGSEDLAANVCASKFAFCDAFSTHTFPSFSGGIDSCLAFCPRSSLFSVHHCLEPLEVF